MRPLYSTLEAENHRFDIYYFHYKGKLEMIEFGIGSYNLNK